jgi:hypothetical protein
MQFVRFLGNKGFQVDACESLTDPDFYHLAEHLHRELLDSTASLAAAISLLERGGKKAAPSDKMFDQMVKDYQKTLTSARHFLNT